MAKVPIDTIWQQFSRSIGGLYAGSDFFDPPLIRLDHRVWALFLEALSANSGTPSEQKMYTVLYVAYRPGSPFTLNVKPSKTTPIETTCLDGQSMTVGYEGVDSRFSVCSTDEYLGRWLLSYGDLTTLLENSPNLHLRVGGSTWHGIHDLRIDDGDTTYFEEIEFRQPGLLRDPGTLKRLFDAARTLLDQMLDADLILPEMPDLDAPLRQASRWSDLWMSRKGRVPIP